MIPLLHADAVGIALHARELSLGSPSAGVRSNRRSKALKKGEHWVLSWGQAARVRNACPRTSNRSSTCRLPLRRHWAHTRPIAHSTHSRVI
ncbi:hypothetical protein BKA67DRAFT_554230, partial [Truncatella angustata]